MTRWNRSARTVTLALGVVALATGAARAQVSTAEEVRDDQPIAVRGCLLRPVALAPAHSGGLLQRRVGLAVGQPAKRGRRCAATRSRPAGERSAALHVLRLQYPVTPITSAPTTMVYSGLTQLYLPLNSRFQFRFDIPFVTSSRGGSRPTYYQANFGDFQVTPRFILSETRDVTQLSNDATIRIPTVPR